MKCPSENTPFNRPSRTASLFFGQHLEQQGIISPEQLKEALELQERQNILLGSLAVERGYMSKSQVHKTIKRQKSLDLPFGAVAVHLGFLNPAQLDALLFTQTIHTTHVGEALMALGYLTSSTFSEMLQQFNTIEDERRQRIQAEVKRMPHPEIFNAALQALQRGFARLTREPTKMQSLNETMAPDFAWLFTIWYDLTSGERIQVNACLTHTDAEAIARKLTDIPPDMPCEMRCLGRNRLFFTIVKRYLHSSLEKLGYQVSESGVSGGKIHVGKTMPAQEKIIRLASPAAMVGLSVRADQRSAMPSPT